MGLNEEDLTIIEKTYKTVMDIAKDNAETKKNVAVLTEKIVNIEKEQAATGKAFDVFYNKLCEGDVCPKSPNEIKTIFFDIVKSEPAELTRLIERGITIHNKKLTKSLSLPLWFMVTILTVFLGWKTIMTVETKNTVVDNNKIVKEVLQIMAKDTNAVFEQKKNHIEKH